MELKKQQGSSDIVSEYGKLQIEEIDKPPLKPALFFRLYTRETKK
jgi:hypothetical protein